MTSVEDEQKVEAIAQESEAKYGVPQPPCPGLAAPDASDDEHRDATEDEEEYIRLEHRQDLAIGPASRAAVRKATLMTTAKLQRLCPQLP
ncbi:MAG: hypothetical protein ACRDOK_30330 [Streptosporangiaceae bacterium]